MVASPGNCPEIDNFCSGQFYVPPNPKSGKKVSAKKKKSAAKAKKGKALVIVESPAKARTIQRYLGNDFEVRASKGHVKDLPERAHHVATAHARLAVRQEGLDPSHDLRGDPLI